VAISEFQLRAWSHERAIEKATKGLSIPERGNTRFGERFGEKFGENTRSDPKKSPDKRP
jgi:hypothetical protein